MKNNYPAPSSGLIRYGYTGVYNFILLIFLFAGNYLTAQVTTAIFNAPANGTFNIPAGVTSVTVQAWGGGGGGGGSNSNNAGGSGGGAGGYVSGTFTVTPLTSFNYTVGAGGTGTTNAGTAGSATTLTGAVTLTANGGSGGIRNMGTGGTGGTATGGSINTNGANGGAGGGNTGGNGGTSPNGGVGGNGGSNSVGVAGTAPGGGGGGGEASGTFIITARSGGNGGAGRVIISYTLPTITGFSPISGCANPTTPVVITGTNFIAPLTVTFNGTPALYTIDSANQITANVPAGATTGNIVVTTATGHTTYSGIFTVNSVTVSGPSSVCTGSTIQLSPNSGGTWTSSNNTIATIDNTGLVNPVSAGSVVFTFSNGFCNGTVPVTVSQAPSITTQPVSQSVCSGTSISFTAGGSGSGLTYQWYNGAAMLSNGGNISGATTQVLTINPVQPADASANYHCVVSGTCAPAATTAMASLAVTEAVAISVQPAATQTLCVGGTANFSVTASGTGLTYQWYNNGSPLSNVGSISGATSSTLTINPLTPGNASSDYYCIVSGTSPCAPVTSSTAALIVNQVPVIVSHPVTTQTVCHGDPVGLSIMTTGGSLTYQWYKGATAVIDGGNIMGANTNTLYFNPAFASDSAPDYYCVVSNSCSTTAVSTNAEIIINNKPIIPTQALTVCSDTAFLVDPVDGVPTSATVVPAATIYSWPAPIVTGGITGGSAQTGQAQISQTLTNPTNTVQTATYTITPTSGTSGNCLGSPFTLTVTVNPVPYIINLTPTICSGQTFSITPPNGGGNIVPAGTTYSWSMPTLSGGITGGSAATNQPTISQTLVNTTNSPQTATYNVTATSGGCVGSTFTMTITVNPKPDVAADVLSQTICSGNPVAEVTISNPNGVPGLTSYTWTRTNTGSITGMAASGSGNITGTLNNTTNTPQTTVFTITATSDEGCVSNTTTASITVNPVPAPAAAPLSQTVCSGIAFTNVNFSTSNSVAGVSYSWIRDNTSNVTGLAASGSGTSLSGTLTNLTNTAQTVTFTLTADVAGCSSQNIFTITVKPQPAVSATPATQSICSSTAISAISVSNPNSVAGTTFAWTRNNTGSVTGMPASGSGASISGTLVNNSGINQTVLFTITATSAGCASAITTAEVVVKPSPNVNSPTALAVCNNASMSLNFTGVAGTVYSFTTSSNPNISGTPVLSGNNISGVLTNSATSPQAVTFTITGTLNGCISTDTTVVTVYPDLAAPVIGESQTVCAGSTPTPLVINVLPTGGTSAYTYQWQSANAASGPWTNIAGATGSSYAPPATTAATPTKYYQVIANSCGTMTSNVVSVAVANNLNFTFSVAGGGGTVCPNTAFNPTITSGQILPDSYIRYTWAADINYITPATGGPIGTTNTVYIFGFPLYSISSATLPLTAINNTNANVTTAIFITPNIYDLDTNTLICSLSPTTTTVTIRPRPVAALTVPNTTICSGTSAGVVATGNITNATMSYTWIRNNTTNVAGTTTGTSGAIAIGGSFTINNVLTNNTFSPQNVTYTVTPVSNGCSGTPATITVTVAPLITAGVIGTSHAVCNGGDPNAFTEVTAAGGSGLTYQWQSSTTGAVGSYTDISGATSPTYDVPAGLTQTTWYIRVVTSVVNGVTCSVATTTPVQVTVNNITPGSIASSQTICSGSTPAAFTSVAAATGTGTISYQWQVSTTGCGGTWANIGGATAATYTVATPLTATTYYRRMATSTIGAASCSDFSNCITITINNITPGSVGSDQTLCNTTNPAAFTQLTPATASGTLTYQWQSNTVGCSGPWTNISGANSATYDPPSGLTVTTYYQRIAISTLNGVTCSVASNCVVVTANAFTAGTINGNRTVCFGGDPAAFTVTVAATGTNLSYQWQSSPTGLAGSWTDIGGATAATYDAPGPVTSIIYYQRITFATVGASTCQAASNFVTVFVNDATASVVAGDQTLCGNTNPAAFTVVTSASGNGALSYQWQSSTTGCSGPWLNISGATSPTYDPPALTQTTYYHVVVTSTLNGSPCLATSNCITVINNAKTWNGSVNADWNSPANWTPTGVPTASNCVTIPNVITDPIISGSNYVAYAYSLNILSGGRLDVNSNNSISVTNFVNVHPLGNFFIQNNASLVQTDNVANTGNIVLARITQPMYRYDFTYWNSPLVMGSYTLGNLSPDTLFDKYYSWNPSISGGNGNWISESSATVMNPTKGYIVRAPQTYSTNPSITQAYTAVFIGTPNNGNINIPIITGSLGAGVSTDKLNLIGNPYPSAVNADLFLNHPQNNSLVDGTIYFWTHHAPPSAANPNPFYGTFTYNYSASGYATYNTLGGTNTVPSGYGSAPPNGYIASGQGFFVKGLTSGTALFNNSMRVSGNNNVFFRTTGEPAFNTALEKHRIWLNLANAQGAFSQILVGYSEGATNGLDRAFDGEFLNSSDLSLYSFNSDKHLAIQGRQLPFEESDIVPLGYNAASAGTYTIGIDRVDGLFSEHNIYLEDKLLNTIHDVRESAYSFATESGTFNERFILRYTSNALGTPDNETHGAAAYIKDDILLVQAGSEIERITVYDISGKLIRTFIPESPSLEFQHEFVYAEGIYFAKVKLASGTTANIKLANR
ncbi:MAG TPA: PKD-like domain-containing protein [Flavobacterium sp.]